MKLPRFTSSVKRERTAVCRINGNVLRKRTKKFDYIFDYIKLKNDRRRVVERIEEFTARRFSPSGVNLSLFPPDHSDPSFRYAANADEHTALLKELARVDNKLLEAEKRLNLILNRLDTDIEHEFVHQAYFKGIPYGRLPKRLHVGKSTVYRNRMRVLVIAEKIQ